MERLLEADLKLLAVEARKRHPMIKEAAERGILKLRTSRGNLLQTADVVQPFILACNYNDPNGRLIAISLGGIQRLVSYKAITGNEIASILRVLQIQVFFMTQISLSDICIF
jgi:hypothetical protein